MSKRAGNSGRGPDRSTRGRSGRPRRRRRWVDTDEFGAMAARVIRAYGRRVADGDPEQLAGLVALGGVVEDAIAGAVERLRSHHEVTWQAIGEALGLSRQGAEQRYGRGREG